MALAECIARAGDALSADDRTFLESQLADGATDEDALNSLQESVAASITVVAQRVQSEGGKIATEPPALPDKPQFYSQTYETDSPLFYSAAERAVETMNLPGWKASKKNPEARAFGHEIWEKIKASGLKAEEIEWMGLEEMLGGPFRVGISKKKLEAMSTDDIAILKDRTDVKFSREEVQAFMKSDGVKIIERLADDKSNLTDKLSFDSGNTVDDPTEWESETEYRMEQWDEAVSEVEDGNAPDDGTIPWFDHGDREYELERYYYDEVKDFYGEPPAENELDPGEEFVNMDEMDGSEILQYYKDQGHDPANDMMVLDWMQAEAKTKAEESIQSRTIISLAGS